MKYKYIVIILVYRNITDLEECIESIYQQISDVRIIVVNSFFDEESKAAIEKVAKKFKCDFVNTENKGYGHGNNIGIRYAKDKYEFEYVIVANPDIIVKNFDSKFIEQYEVIAPKIISKSGKMQNPMYVCENRISEWLQYIGCKYSWNYITYAGMAINKILRGLTSNIYHNDYYIYGAHGSFVIFRYCVINRFSDLYDEHMFLFGEELLLGYKLKKIGIRTRYVNEIEIYHKEDGSVKLSDLDIGDIMKASHIYYYSHYRKKEI